MSRRCSTTSGKFALLLVATGLAATVNMAAGSCMRITPRQSFAFCSDVFLARVTRIEIRPMVRVGPDTWHESDVIVHLELLASWKGTRADTLSLVSGHDYEAQFVEKGVSLVYGHRGKDGQLYSSACERTRPIRYAREDSIALGKPVFDRLGGRKWAAFSPPAVCPVHHVALDADYSRINTWLGPQRQKAFPVIEKSQFPYAAVWLTGEPVKTYVCPICRASAEVWMSR